MDNFNFENNLIVQSLTDKQLLVLSWYIDIRNLQGSFSDDWVNLSFDKFLKDNFIKSLNRSYSQVLKDEFNLTFDLLENLATPYIWFKNI